MNDKLENMFKNRLNDVYMDSDTTLKIKKIRGETLNEIKEYLKENHSNFPKINHELIKQCTAFDRKTEIKKEKYSIELFINIDCKEIEIEKINNEIYKIKKNKQYLTPKFIFEQIIMESLQNTEYDYHNQIVKKKEENIMLNIIPCIHILGTYYLFPHKANNWKQVKIEKINEINNVRIKESIFILKYWAQCQGFYDKEIDYFIEKKVIKYYIENNADKEYIYLDFNCLLNYIFINRSEKIGKKTNALKEVFAGVLRKNITLSEKMISNETPEKCFKKIFG